MIIGESTDMSMTSRTKTIIKIAVVGGLLVTAGAMTVSRLRQFTTTGEQGLQVWFYDLSERQLYAVARDTVPPHNGIGGEKNDGVKAVVVANRTECGNGTKRRIAYLETYTPEHKQLEEGVRAARAERRPYGRPIPDAEGGFYEKNTLVRRVDDPKWYDMTTPEAKRIVSVWRSERGPDGKTLEVCTP